MKWLKAIALVLGALLGVAALVPFFVTLNDYIPTLEKELSARVGEPVAIENLHAALLPVPHARVEGITIGTADDAQVGKVTLKPDLWSLFRSQKVIRSVELDDVTLTQKSLVALAALSQGDKGAGNVRVENVRLSNAVVKLEHSKFGPFDVHVRVSGPGEQGLVTLKTRDDALEAKAVPDGEQFRIEISARKWTPPMGPGFVFDQLEMKGVVRGKDAELPNISAKLYGGSATGALKLEWDKGIAIKGNLELTQIEVAQPLAILSPTTRFTGRLDAKPVFSAQAASAEQLDEALKLESPFTVHNGVLHGFDIAAAAVSLGQQTRGGETRFDQLSGKLALDQRSYRFSDLKIASGAIAARGNVGISPSKALSGQISANVGAYGKAVTIPLSVSGTLDAPMLLPNAGAVTGTRFGEVMDGLFGAKR